MISKNSKQLNFVLTKEEYKKFKEIAAKDYRKPTEMARMLVLKLIQSEG